MSATPTAKAVLAAVQVEPCGLSLIVRFTPGNTFGGLDRVLDDFTDEFRGLGERSWRRTQFVWYMPHTPSIEQRVRLWCELMGSAITVDWRVAE